MSHHNNESTTISTYDHDDEKSIKDPEKDNINQNDVDIGIIEIKPGVYSITNPVKYRKYLLSLDDTTEKTSNNKE